MDVRTPRDDTRADMAKIYSIDKAERQATLAINRMYGKLASDIVNTDLDSALNRFGESDKRRLYLAFMQAYAAGVVEANRLIRKHAPKRVFAADYVGEAYPLEDDPYIAQYTTEAIMSLEDIAVSDRKEIRWRMMHALERGASIENTTNDLLKYFDGDRIRATRFARTATSDIYNRATLHRYEDSGVVDGVQFMAHIDNRTSDACRVLNRTIWAINDPGIQTPPLHFNCFIEGTRLEPTGDIVAAFRARYDGQVVELTLSDGRRLTVTPNHMLLTPDGFLAAQFASEGDNIVCRTTLERGIGSVDPNNNEVYPLVEDVFSALSVSRGVCTESMPATPVDLHGDGAFVDGDIDVVTSKRLLLGARDSAVVEHFNEHVLGSTNLESDVLPSFGNLASMLFSVADAADGRMSGIRETAPFFGGRVSHPNIHGVTPISKGYTTLTETIHNDRRSNTEFLGKHLDRSTRDISGNDLIDINNDSFGGCKPQPSKPSVYRRGTNPEMVGELLTTHARIIEGQHLGGIDNTPAPGGDPSNFQPIIDRSRVDAEQLRHLLDVHSGMIELQEIIHINVFPFHGYIYDFQTISTLCIGNGVVTSNCRSRIICYFGKIPGARDYTKDFDQETINKAFQTSNTFRNKYWNRFPRTRSSAVLQRHYLSTIDIDTIRLGLTKLIDSKAITGIEHDRLKLLKALLRRRVIERDSSIIVDAFGKSLLLDVAQRNAMRAGLAQLIRLQRLKIDRATAELPIWLELTLPRKKREIKDMKLTLSQYEIALDELPF